VGPLAIALLAALPPPLVEGRVGEVKGAPAAFATVTLAQDDRTQVVRTGADGKFRFRAFEGPATVTVKLPQGWTPDISILFEQVARHRLGIRRLQQ